jgi:hypothetical protein
VSRRGHYPGGHSLTFGSGQKDDDGEYWADAKARADAMHERAQSCSGPLREKLDALEAQRLLIRNGLRDGTTSLADGEAGLSSLVDELERLKAEAKNAGIKFAPDNGIGRTSILAKDMLAYVEMLRSWDDGEELDVIRLYLD